MNYQYKRDVIIGLSDGLIIPFALSAGLSNVTGTNNTILLVCLAQLTAGSIAMGFSGYQTNRSEVSGNPGVDERAIKDEKQLFAALGLPEEEQMKAAEGIVKEKQLWNENVSGKFTTSSPSPSGVIIGFSYLLGGLIPLLPYMWYADPREAVIPSAVLTMVSLFALGYSRSHRTAINPWVGALRMVMIGFAAAVAAILVSLIFK